MKKVYPFIFFITILLVLFIISANVNRFDFDLWARLIAGMGVIEGHQVLKTDILSYTPTHTWWDHEYGSGVVFYIFLKYFGAYSLILLQTVICFLIFFFVTKIINIRGQKEPYNFLFWLFPIIALAENFGSPIRCHLFSFLLFTIFLYILEHVRRGNTKLIYILPVLTVIWNNLHGGVVAGLGLIAMFGIGEIIEKKPFKHYITAGIISFAALIINPWGWEYIKFLLMANFMPRPDVAEWWGIFSKHQLLNQIPFKIMLSLFLILESLVLTKYYRVSEGLNNRWKYFDKTKLILLIVTLYLSIAHVKMIPFFVITFCAYCYEDFKEYIEIKLPKNIINLTTYIMFAVCIFALSVKTYELPAGDYTYPIREVEFLKINNIKGNILANFGFGSYISYKLYPHNKIFMDGRYEEVYNDDMIPLLKKFFLIKPGWDEVLKKYPPDIILVEKDYPIFMVLNRMPEWNKAYESERFVLYLNKKLTQNSYIQPTDNLDYYKNTLFDTDIKF